MKNYLKLFLVLSLFIAPGTHLNAQTRKERRAAEEAKTKQLIESQYYVFVARTVNPTGGRSRQVSNDYYTVKVSKDTVIADLPYFGQAYSAPIGSNTGGINFTSLQFDYKMEQAKRGGYNISIVPKDNSDTRQITLNVGSGGVATVIVISNNRQTISFTGQIEERKK